jgi:hypothetical protein
MSCTSYQPLLHRSDKLCKEITVLIVERRLDLLKPLGLFLVVIAIGDDDDQNNGDEGCKHDLYKV